MVGLAVVGVQLLAGGKMRLTLVDRALDLVDLGFIRFARLVSLGGREAELINLDLTWDATLTCSIGLILRTLLLLSKLCRN